MAQHDQSSAHHETPHSVSYTQYLLIWLGLVMLTGLTVALAGVDLGRWIIVTALAIASIKTMMVLEVFMHLKFEDKTFRLFVLVACVTLAIFFILTFFDYAFA
jgi:cytochrome c oxidase subunit 4